MTASQSQGVSVATGDGVLDLLELQAEGGKVLPARAFLAGHPLKPARPSGGRMIAPARRAAYDALLAHAVSGTDLAAAVSAVRRGLTEPRDQTLLTELVIGTRSHARRHRYQLARAARGRSTLWTPRC